MCSLKKGAGGDSWRGDCWRGRGFVSGGGAEAKGGIAGGVCRMC